MPPHLEFDDALAHLRHALVAMTPGGPRRHPVIGIAGPAGSGKSHLARALSSCIVATDDYLPDYDATPEHVRDLPESSDLERLAGDLALLASGRPARVPRWSFFEHRRTGEELVHPAAPIVCEGLHALHERVRTALDIMVYVDAPPEARWARVEARERAGQRGWPIDYARHFFHNVAEPTYAALAPHYRGVAHLIVRNDRAMP